MAFLGYKITQVYCPQTIKVLELPFSLSVNNKNRLFCRFFVLTEILVLVGQFLNDFQGVGLDVLLQHLRRCVTSYLHNIVQINCGIGVLRSGANETVFQMFFRDIQKIIWFIV